MINLTRLSKQVKTYLSKIAVVSDPKLQQLSALSSFVARVRFCESNWAKIKAGTARIAYDYNSDLIIKLAKNEKGLQQNRTESDGFIQSNYKDIVANVMDSDPDNKWMVVEKAYKITPTEFKAMVGISIDELCKYLKYRIENIKPYVEKSWDELVDEENQVTYTFPNEEQLEENHFIKELIDMMANFKMPVGDLCRISSFGKSKGRCVVVDYGLTQDIWEQYYKR